MAEATIRYVESEGASIAYLTYGEGEMDLLVLPGWLTQIEHLWEEPALRRFNERLASFARLIVFDVRGTGLSERNAGDRSLGQEARDALAVLEAVGSERAAIFTYGQGGFLGSQLAAEHPERVLALVMYASIARTAWAPDYEWAMRPEEYRLTRERANAHWGEVDRELVAQLAPSAAEDATLQRWLARSQRLAASPREANAIAEETYRRDVRALLPHITVPTLVMHRPAEQVWDVRHSRYLAENIPGARYVELAGADSLPFVGDSEAVLDEIQQFLTGSRAGGVIERELLTVVFTDIVDATATAARMGDVRWRALLAAHDAAVRSQLAAFGGREVKTVGDGFLAAFAGTPSRALRCAQAISQAAAELGLDLRIGIHTGECELVGEDIAGMAVHIASRVAGLAQPGEVLVSGTVYGTVVGGPFEFGDRGMHHLRGVPVPWPLFALAS